MRLLIVLFLGFFLQESSLIDLRKKYENAALDEESFEAFTESIENFENKDEIAWKGYHSVNLMFSARYFWNPFDKLDAFNEGREELDDCIEKYPENLELRYLRLAVQINAPGILGYDENIEEDKLTLLNNLASCDDVDLKKRIASYMLKDVELSETERLRLKNETDYLFTSSN